MGCFFANRDSALYALGVGACGTNAVDADELKYVYHNDGQEFIKVLIIPFSSMNFVQCVSLDVADLFIVYFSCM